MLSTVRIPKPEMVEGAAQARRLREKIQNVGIMAVDTETTGIDRPRDHVVFWSMSDGKSRWCLDRAALPEFKAFLEDPARDLVFQNANFDAWMLLNSGVDLSAKGPRTNYRRYDTAVMHCLYKDNEPHDLKSMSGKYLGVPMVSFRKTFDSSEKDTGKKLLEFYKSDPQKVIDYASLDAWATFKLYERLTHELDQMALPTGGTLLDYYFDLEVPMTEILWQMERQGAYIDTKYLATQIPGIEDEMLSVRRLIAQAAGRVINPNSPAQLVELFYKQKANGDWIDDDGRAPIKMTGGGSSGNRKPSVDVEVLKFRAETGCSLAQKLLRYRKLTKITGTYMIGVLRLVTDLNRLHTTFNQHVTATGRLSSSSPNLQNWPRPGKDEFGIRNAIIAPPGHVLGVADYGQLEMRIVASLANETKMIDAIKAGRDMHAWTAFQMFNVPYDEILAAKKADDAEGVVPTAMQKDLLEYRAQAKTVGFGTLYGEGPRKLSQQLGIEYHEAKQILASYFVGYPAIKQFFDWNVGRTADLGYALTPLGRRRRIPQIHLGSGASYAEGVRAANNFPIQGHAAELTKLAQIRLWEDDHMWNAGVRMTLQVHDEIVAEIPEHISMDPDFRQAWNDHMQFPFGPGKDALAVPLEADIHFGPTWTEAK